MVLVLEPLHIENIDTARFYSNTTEGCYRMHENLLI